MTTGIIAHGLLTRAPEAAERILPIDFSTKREALHTNLATRREALAWLNDGHVLLIFPAGGVAAAEKPFGQATDFRWRPFTAKLIHGAKTPVLPMYTAGQNSRFYQLGLPLQRHRFAPLCCSTRFATRSAVRSRLPSAKRSHTRTLPSSKTGRNSSIGCTLTSTRSDGAMSALGHSSTA